MGLPFAAHHRGPDCYGLRLPKNQPALLQSVRIGVICGERRRQGCRFGLRLVGRVLVADLLVLIAAFRACAQKIAILAIIINGIQREERVNNLTHAAARHGLQLIIVYGLCAVFRLSVQRSACARLPCRLCGQVFTEAVFTPLHCMHFLLIISFSRFNGLYYLLLLAGRILAAGLLVVREYIVGGAKLFTAILARLRSETIYYLPPSAARHGLQLFIIHGLCAVFRLSVQRLACARLPCRLCGQVFTEAVFTPPLHCIHFLLIISFSRFKGLYYLSLASLKTSSIVLLRNSLNVILSVILNVVKNLCVSACGGVEILHCVQDDRLYGLFCYCLLAGFSGQVSSWASRASFMSTNSLPQYLQ